MECGQSHQPQPNWVVFIFCGSTQTLGFMPICPIRGVNRCQYLLSLAFYLFTFILSFPLYLLDCIFIPGLEMLKFFLHALSLAGGKATPKLRSLFNCVHL